MQAARYALRSEQIPDRVLCQRSALVIGADEFRSFHRVNVLNATRMIGREKADRTRSLSPHRFGNAQHRINILLDAACHAWQIFGMEIQIKNEPTCRNRIIDSCDPP